MMRYKICFALTFLASALTTGWSQSTEAVVEKYQKLKSDIEVFDIAIDADNNKWLATDQGLVKFSAINSEPEIFPTDTSVLALAADDDEAIWSARANNLIFDPTGFSVMEITPKEATIQCMAFYRRLLYIGTDQGMFTYNPKTNRASRVYQKDNSRIPSNNITMLFADPYEQLWIGTDAGVVQMRRNNMKVLEKDHEFQAAAHTREGIWLVSDKEIWVVNMKESKTGRWYPADVSRGLSKGKVRALAADSKGRIYLASEIVVQFDPYKNKAVTFDRDYGFVSSKAVAIITDKNDDLWVGTGDEGMFRIDVIEGESEELTAVAFVTNELKCHGQSNGSVELKINGGKLPYSIKWNSGAREKTKLQGLNADIYTATITDAEGQVYVASTELTQPDSIVITEVENQRVSKYRARDGVLKVAVSGGTKPYTLRWSNGKRGILSQTGLPYGDYTLTVIDDNYCEAERTFKIDKPKVLPQLDISKIEVGQALRIEELYFEADSAKVEQTSFAVLDEIYDFLEANRNVIVEIGGHTNLIPSHEYSDRLSTARAKNVAEYLYDKGLSKDQIIYKGYGKRQPIVRDIRSPRQELNQRVELKILEIKRN